MASINMSEAADIWWISVDVIVGNNKTVKKTVIKTKCSDVVGHVV